MAKFTREDDEKPDRPRQSGGNAVVLVVLAVVGAFVLLAAAGGLAAMWLFARTADREAQALRVEAEALRDEARAAEAMARNAADKPVKSREEWAKLLVGKTRDEVTEIAGRPDRTSDAPPWTWSYDRRSSDPESATIDPTMTVWFRGADGPVERVSF